MLPGSRISSDVRRKRFRAPLVVVTGGMLVLSACSGGGGDESKAATPSTTTAAPVPTSVPGAAETSGVSAPAGSAKDQQPSQPFVADTNPDVSSEREGYPVSCP